MAKDLFVPTKIAKEDIYGKGFGKRELKRLVPFIGIGALCGAAFAMIKSMPIKSFMISTVVGALIAGGFGYFLFQKNSINISMYDYLAIMVKFFKSQKLFVYQKMKGEFDIE